METKLTEQKPIDPVLFNWPQAEPTLRASRCALCGAIAFPLAKSCKSCGSEEVAETELPRRGKLWAWTIQHFMPKPPYNSSETPETFRPYGLGYIDLPGGLKIESRLTENDPMQLKIGADMELVFYTHRLEQDGTEIINYAFKPV